MRPEDPDPGAAPTAAEDAAPEDAPASAHAVETLAHELRMPLHAVIGFAELLLARGDRMDPLARRRALEAIVRNGRRGARLLDEGDSTGRREVREEVVDVAEAIDQVVRDLAITREIRVEAEPRLRVVTDPDHLAQILGNLLSRARERTAAPVSVVAVGHEGEAVVGIGGDVDGPRGGIGLAVSRRLAELNGGSLEVGGELPGGSGQSGCVLRLPIASARRRAQTGPWRVEPPATGAEHAAVTAPPTGGIPGRRAVDQRLQIQRLELHRLGRALTATTGLRLEADEVAGTALGEAGLTATVETVARATLAAVEEALGGATSLELERVTVDRSSDGHVTVRVRARSGDDVDETLVGAALIEDDHEQAAMKATLGALNRRFGHYVTALPA